MGGAEAWGRAGVGASWGQLATWGGLRFCWWPLDRSVLVAGRSAGLVALPFLFRGGQGLTFSGRPLDRTSGQSAAH